MDSKREEFEKWVRDNRPHVPLDRAPDDADRYDGVFAAWTWDAWQAALASLQPAEPVAKTDLLAEYRGKELALNARQLRAALDYAAPDWDVDVDQRDTEVCIQWLPERMSVDGEKMEAGLYLWDADYPDEGVILLDADYEPEAAASPLPLASREQIRNEALSEAVKVAADLLDACVVSKYATSAECLSARQMAGRIEDSIRSLQSGAGKDAEDARRYRWLRSRDRGMAALAYVVHDDANPPYFELKCEADLDAAIDAAIAQKENG